MNSSCGTCTRRHGTDILGTALTGGGCRFCQPTRFCCDSATVVFVVSSNHQNPSSLAFVVPACAVAVLHCGVQAGLGLALPGVPEGVLPLGLRRLGRPLRKHAKRVAGARRTQGIRYHHVQVTDTARRGELRVASKRATYVRDRGTAHTKS